MSSEDDSITKSYKPRWKFTNDVIAFTLVISFVISQMYLIYQGQGYHYAYVISVLATVGWLFGKELIDRMNGTK